MLLVDDAFGEVPVHHVHGQVERLGLEVEVVMDLDQEIDKERPQVPGEFGLKVHVFRHGHCLFLHLLHVLKNLFLVFQF